MQIICLYFSINSNNFIQIFKSKHMDNIYSNFNRIESCGIKEESYSKYDILLLPENIFRSSDKEIYTDAQDTIGFYKYLKNNNINVANSIDLRLESRIKERRGGNEIWLGVIQFIQNGMTNIFWGLLGSYLYNELKIEIPITKINNEQSIPNMHITVITKDYKIDYEGNADEFIKIIKNFSNVPLNKSIHTYTK
jgi:hypothetical protein